MTSAARDGALGASIEAYQRRIEGVLERELVHQDPATSRLCDAMRYSVLGGGKRLRPVLVYLTGEAFGAPGYFRMSYALGDDDLAEGVSRLAKLFGEAA